MYIQGRHFASTRTLGLDSTVTANCLTRGLELRSVQVANPLICARLHMRQGQLIFHRQGFISTMRPSSIHRAPLTSMILTVVVGFAPPERALIRQRALTCDIESENSGHPWTFKSQQRQRVGWPKPFRVRMSSNRSQNNPHSGPSRS